MSKIITIKTQNEPEIELSTTDSDNKDWALVRTMAQYARPAPQKNLTHVKIESATRKTKLAMVLLPEWGVQFAPYNMSRLIAVARSSGYFVKGFDVNIECFRSIRYQLKFDAWHPSKEFLWAKEDTYFEQVHSYCQPIYERIIDQIKDLNPDVVGFTLYYTNEQATRWFVKKLKSVLPNTKFIVGGPQAYCAESATEDLFDYVVQGEGEKILLEILESLEHNQDITSKFLVQPKSERINLDLLPIPDFSDFDLSKYLIPNGTSSEISRGCVAKCVFCTEVNFWKYRGRQAISILDEIEHQYKTYGINYVWFIDSLVNGNLNELRAFALGVKERRLPISWQGYARCDIRMDLEYYKDLAASGCKILQYGIESGSQRVLDAMKKSITVQGIEENLMNSTAVKISSQTNWIIGFPSEEPIDFAHTITLLYRIRNYGVNSISPGISLMLSPNSEIANNEEKFNITNKDFLGSWTTKDLTNTKLHRMIRQKSFVIFCKYLNPKLSIMGAIRPSLEKMHKFVYNKSNQKAQIDYEDFDYNIIKPGINPFVDTVVNEQWPLLRTMWRIYGGFSAEIIYSPKEDLDEWGHRLACDYTANYKFSIDDLGNWSADFNMNLQQDQLTFDLGYDDYSFAINWQGQGKW